MTRTEILLQYVALAERILQKHYSPGRPYGGLGGGQQFPEPEKFTVVRNVDEVLAAAEKVRAWCEPPAPVASTKTKRRR